jgi:hypothetical protein
MLKQKKWIYFRFALVVIAIILIVMLSIWNKLELTLWFKDTKSEQGLNLRTEPASRDKRLIESTASQNYQTYGNQSPIMPNNTGSVTINGNGLSTSDQKDNK